MGGAGLLTTQASLALIPELAPKILVVGVAKYDHIPDLPSAALDASLIALAFRKLGVDVTLQINPRRDEFLTKLAHFGATGAQNGLTMIYAATHGGMLNGQNHLFFKDSQSISDRVPETILLKAMNTLPRQKILFLDSCRESPIAGADTEHAVDQYRAGVHVSYAAQPGAPAFDGENGHSPYAHALQTALEIPGLDMFALSRRIRLQVMQQTGGLQIPWDRSSLISPVVLNAGS